MPGLCHLPAPRADGRRRAGHCCFHKGVAAVTVAVAVTAAVAAASADGSGIGSAGAGHGLFGHRRQFVVRASALALIRDWRWIGRYATTWAQPSSQAGPLPSGQSICGQPGCDDRGEALAPVSNAEQDPLRLLRRHRLRCVRRHRGDGPLR